jgi:hypothetical protein
VTPLWTSCWGHRTTQESHAPSAVNTPNERGSGSPPHCIPLVAAPSPYPTHTLSLPICVGERSDAAAHYESNSHSWKHGETPHPPPPAIAASHRYALGPIPLSFRLLHAAPLICASQDPFSKGLFE